MYELKVVNYDFMAVITSIYFSQSCLQALRSRYTRYRRCSRWRWHHACLWCLWLKAWPFAFPKKRAECSFSDMQNEH